MAHVRVRFAVRAALRQPVAADRELLVTLENGEREVADHRLVPFHAGDGGLPLSVMPEITARPAP